MNPIRSITMSASTTVRRLRGLSVAVVACLATGGVFAAVASGDTYSIIQCAPGNGAPDGWSGATGGQYMHANNGCSAQQPIEASWEATIDHPGGDNAFETFSAAADTTLTRIQAHRTARFPPDAQYASPIGRLDSDTGGLMDYVGGNAWLPSPQDGWIDHALPNAHSVTLSIACSGFRICRNGEASYALNYVTFTALDNAAPTLSGGLEGSLASDASLHGTEEITATLNDRGAGVYRVRLLQDDAVRTIIPVDANGGRCVDANAGNADPFEFAYRVPCKLTVSGTWGFDSAAMSDGSHNVKVQAEDAAGNVTTIVNRRIIADNQPATVSTPTVAGSAVEGQTLVCEATVNGQSPQVAYQWIRAGADGSGQQGISGATDPTYVVRASDAGRKLLCRVTAADLGGASTATSALTSGPFADGGLATLARPTVAGPVVDGPAVEGQSVTCAATVAGTGVTSQVRWLRAAADGSGGAPIAGADGRTYLLVAADVGRRILCSVTAQNTAGSVTATSDPLGAGLVVARAAEAVPSVPTTPTTPSGATGAAGSTGSTGSAGSDGSPGASAAAAQNTASVARDVATRDLNVVGVPNPDAAGENGAPVDPEAVVSVYFQLGAGSRSRTAATATAKFSQRLRIRGTLKTHDGRPIAGAKVYLAQTTGRKDATGALEWKLDGGTVSRSDGSILMFSTAAGKTRQIRLVYFPYGGRVGNRGSNVLALKVQQGASLSLSKRRLHNGQTLAFSGAVRGAISRGTKVQLQVKLAAGWSTFRQATVASSGRFRAHWRFQRTTRRTTYTFRVRVLPASGSGYVASTSAGRRVVVLP